MKKVIALLLAVFMILSFCTVIFAASDEAATLADADGPYFYADKKAVSQETFEFGQTVYILLFDKNGDVLNKEKSVDELMLKAEWEEGEDYIGDVTFEKISVNKIDGHNLNKRMYVIAIETEGSSSETIDVSGRIYIKGRSGTEGTSSDRKVDAYMDIDFALGYDKGTVDPDSLTVYEEDGKLAYDFTDIEEENYTIYFDEYAEVLVDVTRDEVVVLSVNNDSIDDIDDEYRSADMRYVALTGSFRRTAEVTIYAEEGGYIYEVVNGSLREMNAEYDDFMEAFVFNARRLGTYAISDIEIDIGEGDDAIIITNTSVAPQNPMTGSAA